MKILLVGTEWFGHWTDYCASALDKLGHRTKIFYWNNTGALTEKIFVRNFPYIPVVTRKIKEKWLNKGVNKLFIKKAFDYSPDLILMLGSTGNPLVIESFKKIKEKLKIPLVCWFGDDPLRFYHFMMNVIYFDFIFVGDPFVVPQVKLIRNSNVEYLPGAVDSDVFKPLILTKEEKEKYDCEIGFVGGSYSSDGGGVLRGKILESLSNYKMKIYGDNSGWIRILKDFPVLKLSFQKRMLPLNETNKFFNAANIVMNIHHPQNKYDTSIRTFEIAASGAFQLADYKKALGELFELNNEIITFTSIPDLQEKTKYFLNHPGERKTIADRLRKKVIKEHTYEIRMKQMFDMLSIKF